MPTARMDGLGEPDVVLICVPAPLTEGRDPDLQYVRVTAEHIAAALRPGQLIVLESTTYPGTTREVVLPILEKSALTHGRDFLLAYSPEREDPGNRQFSTASIPKLVGGVDAESGRLAELLYSQVFETVIRVQSCEVAEAVLGVNQFARASGNQMSRVGQPPSAAKILENVYRAVNIALVNELKLLFDKMGLDVWEVIEAAKTKPFGFQPFYPGPGLGGHCIPIDPFYLSWVARKHGLTTRFVELAGEINTRMPLEVVDRVMLALNDHSKPVRGSRICILGVAYKKDIDDTRESPSFVLMDLLQQSGAIVTYNDPHVPKLKQTRRYDFSGMESTPLTPKFLSSQDCILIATDHSAYNYDEIVRHASLIVDTRNATRHVQHNRHKIYKA